MKNLKTIFYIVTVTLITPSFLNDAHAVILDIEKFESQEITVPQNAQKSSSRVDLLWKFWENDNALLTLFKLKKLKVFMKEHPQFLDPPSKEYISKIKYDAHIVGNFSFLIKKKNESVKCENSKLSGRTLEMKIGEDSGSTVKDVATAFVLKICPNEDTEKGLTVSAEISMDSKDGDKPWSWSPKGQVLSGIASEIKESIEVKLPENLPLFLKGKLQDVQGKPVLSVDVDNVMNANCSTCHPKQAANESLKNLPATSTTSNSKTDLATSGK